MIIILIFTLIGFISCEEKWFSESHTRLTRQTSTCGKFKFTCTSGECLPDSVQCDGLEDCKDGSDEANCEGLVCPSFTFQCKYGACINSNLECNGEKNCKDNSDETSPKCSNTGNQCLATQFKCDSGDCIREDLVCDGNADCNDKSDETATICSKFECPAFTFKCNYGACINDNAKCDGRVDCVDGSDENPTLCGGVITSSPPSTDKPSTVNPNVMGCIVPPYPHNGKHAVQGISNKYPPGSTIPSSAVLRISCNNGYRLDPNNEYVFCQGNTRSWSSKIPECKLTCEPARITTSTNATCTYQSSRVDCRDWPFSGTIAKYECNPLYEDLSLTQNPYRLCKDGSWDYPAPNCIATCGMKNVDAQKLVIGGTVAKKGDYPWQVALYNKTLDHICGGSLITQRTVLTAAHCVTDNYGKQNAANLFKVGVGKYFRAYNHKDDTEAQYADVKHIYVPDRYTGPTNNYAFDVAVLETATSFQLTYVVQPVCIDWTNTYETEQLRPNNMGVVTGWGYSNENGQPSEVLKELSVPYVADGTCVNDLPEGFKKYFTVDKICAGYLQNGSNACRGDSGGGLAFPRQNRYYIRGIVSISPRSSVSGGCDSDQYALYTKVSQHIEFIRYHTIGTQ